MKVKVIRKKRGLEKLRQKLPEALKKGVSTAAEQTQKLAVQFAHGSAKDGIQIRVIDMGTFEVKAEIYTDFPFAAFLEYGTGIHMEDNPLGHIPGSAGERGEPWFVHEDMADLSRYHFPVLDTPAGRFYLIRGTHAHPYMRPAAFQGRDESVKAVAEAIRGMLRGAAK